MSLAFNFVKSREKTVDLIVDNFKDMLVSGVIKAGDALPPISVMAENMNVGISSAREALKVLEALGVLEIVHGKGIFVSNGLCENTMNPLTFQLMVIPRDVHEFIEFRKMFETASTLVALQNATEADIKQIRVIVESYLEKIKTKPSTIQDEMDFHRAVLSATHNNYIIKIGETMLDLLASSMQKKPVREKEFTVQKSHIDIYEALRDRDKGKLILALEESYEGWEIKYFTEESEET